MSFAHAKSARHTYTPTHTLVCAYFNGGGKTSRRPASCTRERKPEGGVRRCQHLSRTDSAPPQGVRKKCRLQTTTQSAKRSSPSLDDIATLSITASALAQFPFPRLLHFPHPRTRYSPALLSTGLAVLVPPRPVFLVCHSPNATSESRLTRRRRARSSPEILAHPRRPPSGLPVVAPVRYPVTRTNLCENFIPFLLFSSCSSPKSQLCDCHLYAHPYANEESE